MNKLYVIVLFIIGLIALTILIDCAPPSQSGEQDISNKVTPPPLTLAATVSPSISPTMISSTPPLTITGSPTLSPALTISSTPSLTMTGSSTPSSPFPKLLAEIPLAPPGKKLINFILNQNSNHLYVIDSAGQLHILNAQTYTPITILPAVGSLLTLDIANHRLYISENEWENDPEAATIVDIDSLTVVGSVSAYGSVAVDSRHNRFYGLELETRKIHLYDGVTLRQIAQSSLEGIPIYNPLRDELYIVQPGTVYSANPETLEITKDLLPDFRARYNSEYMAPKTAVTGAFIFPERNLFIIEKINLGSGGHPPTSKNYYTFFDATTLATTTVDLSVNKRECSDPLTLIDPIDGYIYREEYYWHNEATANLLVYDRKDNLVTWRDGLTLELLNPNTKQMYYYDLVLDLATLSPLGSFPAPNCFSLDIQTGQIIGLKDENLLIFSQEGGKYEPPLPTPVDALPLDYAGHAVIQPSPDYRNDHTLFLLASGNIYRSQNGGQSWMQLKTNYSSVYNLAISPDFAHDQTLFVYGRGSFEGKGVYRSTDSGDTWQPVWQGLTSLRVYNLILSPNYALDGALLAYVHTKCLLPFPSDPCRSGYFLFSSIDRGLSWTLVESESALETKMLSITGPATRFRIRDGRVVERSDDSGKTWRLSLALEVYSSDNIILLSPNFASDQTVYIKGGNNIFRSTNGGETWTLSLTLEGYSWDNSILLSPNFATDRTVYIWNDHNIFHSTDGGETWQKWLLDQDDKFELTGVAISPPLDNDQYQLFVGTKAGDFRVLTPTLMTWGPIPTPTASPTPTSPTPTLMPTPTFSFSPTLTSTPTAETALVPVNSPYAEIWTQLGGAEGPLGNPIAPAVEADYAFQPFEHGLMHWGWSENDNSFIHLLLASRLGGDGSDSANQTGETWLRYQDNWQEGDEEYPCPQATPPFGPRRGFGRVWCECQECRTDLGSPLAPEHGDVGGYQNFEGGVLLSLPTDNTIYAIFENGAWQRIEYSK